METFSPQQLAKEGQTEYINKRYLSAANLFQAAADGFLAAGDELKAAEQANNCSVAYLRGGEARKALDAALGTEAIFTRKGDLKGQAIAIGNQASALEKLKKIDEALSAYQRSATILMEVGEDELRAYAMQSISSLLLKKHRYLEAYATMRAGIMGLKKPNLRQRLLKKLIDIPYSLIR